MIGREMGPLVDASPARDALLYDFAGCFCLTNAAYRRGNVSIDHTLSPSDDPNSVHEPGDVSE